VGAVAGTVTDAGSGEPMGGVRVVVTSTDDGVARGAATTNSDGEYEIIGLAPGQYRVEANTDGYQSASKQVAVAAGERPRVDFQLQPGGLHGADTGAITGQVTDATQDAEGGIDSAQVTATDGQGVAQDTATTDADGTYQLTHLPPGDYTVRADAAGYQPDTNDNIAVEAGQRTTGVDFALIPLDDAADEAVTRTQPGAVTGNVRDADTKDPLTGAEVTAYPSDDDTDGISLSN